MTKPRRSTRGFSMIELMIVVGIIAILAAVALPSYTKYVFRVRQAEALTILAMAKNAQFAHYALRDCFVPVAATPAAGTPGPIAQQWDSVGSAAAGLPCADTTPRSFEDITVRPSLVHVYYEYECTARFGVTSGSTDDFTCAAYGNLDGDPDFFEMVYGTDNDADGVTIATTRGSISGFPNDPVRISPGIY